MFKILVLEDDRDLNHTVCSFLNASGYQAVGCHGANEAYDAMYESTFDLIVSDIMMPGIDGYEFAKTVRSPEELSGVETLRTDFIANVSHELKTPLAVMQNCATLLQSPDLTEARRSEYAKAITEQSRRLADLITNILKLDRLENQQIYPAARRFNLGEQLAECLLNFESTWEKKEIELETDIEEEVSVESDDELLSLVWNNLFSNALKFTEPGGRVSVTMKTEGDFAIINVSDTGCGISTEVGKHIFEKFYQGDASHAAQGNGLGLALVKRVVDIVGGDISVKSEVGKGSEFTVKIRRTAGGNNQKNT